MNSQTPVELARAAFDSPSDYDSLTEVQHALAAWQGRNFGAVTLEQAALGVSEETGELAHAILKHTQRIRGMEDPTKFREAAGDALADIAIYSMQLATCLRLDYETLVRTTAEKVMARDWTKDKQGGGEPHLES